MISRFDRLKIGLLDVDGHRFPNLALMKLSSYYKQMGSFAEWYDGMSEYDIVFKGKVFTFSDDYLFHIRAGEVIRGGTGYGIYEDLPEWIDRIYPDYSLYEGRDWYDGKLAYGFLTRGCPNKCSWCIVPKKEGNIRSYMDVEEIAGERNRLILMDNNILSIDYGFMQIEKIIKKGYRVDFNQGLDSRLITDDVAFLLSRVKWINYIRLACDSDSAKDPLEKAVRLLRKHRVKTQIFVYVLLKELGDSYDRINFCKRLGLYAFAQPYRDFTLNQIIPQWQKDMARYTNLKQLYKSMDFKEYIPRKNFKCESYFI